MKAALPPLLPFPEIQKRLLEIFPEGTPNRGYCTREIAAKTVFVMLYVGAVESRDVHIRPNQVTSISFQQNISIVLALGFQCRECLPAMDDRHLIDFGDPQENAFFQFRFRSHADPPQKGPCHLAK